MFPTAAPTILAFCDFDESKSSQKDITFPNEVRQKIDEPVTMENVISNGQNRYGASYVTE